MGSPGTHGGFSFVTPTGVTKPNPPRGLAPFPCPKLQRTRPYRRPSASTMLSMQVQCIPCFHASMLLVGGWEERIARLFERANTILATRGRGLRAWTACSDAAQACTEWGTALVHSRRALDSANRLVASHESVIFREEAKFRHCNLHAKLPERPNNQQ